MPASALVREIIILGVLGSSLLAGFILVILGRPRKRRGLLVVGLVILGAGALETGLIVMHPNLVFRKPPIPPRFTFYSQTGVSLASPYLRTVGLPTGQAAGETQASRLLEFLTPFS